MNRRYALPAAGVLTLALSAGFVPFMKDAIDTGLAGDARTALASKGVTGVEVNSDWASLTLKGQAADRTPALTAVHAMANGGAVHTVTYICTDGSACSSGPVPVPSVTPSASAPATPTATATSPSATVAPPPASPTAMPTPSGSPGTSAPKASDVQARIRKALGKDGVTFAYASANLTPQAKAVLRDVASMLAQAPDLTVTIAGYTDNRGSATGNRALSLARAQATAAYLAEHGVAADRMKAVGFGAEHPIATNATAAGRAANRRIEFTVQGG